MNNNLNYYSSILEMYLKPYDGINIEHSAIQKYIEDQHLFLVNNQNEFITFTLIGNCLILSNTDEERLYVTTYICNIQSEGFACLPIKNKSSKKYSRIKNIIKEYQENE